MLPAYGGSLFDPDRYPFLEGRAQGTRWQSSPAAPLEINNRVVLHLLKSLQMLQVKVPGGGPAEALRVSFEGLNIEQIGHVYEGLLDHTAVRAKEVVLGLAASRKKPVASITLAALEKLRQDDEVKLFELLEEETGRSGKALDKALKNGGEPEDFHKLLVACGQDKALAERIIPFRGLLRQDSFDRLVVVLPGGIYVGQGSARRSTGTHYTPRSLTEPIVQHTLEPLVYLGPAEGLPKEQWRLRSPKEILDLKVCDMAMGSGAFLVQACRYLSERLVEAWENLEKEHPGEVLITPEGGFSKGEPSERLIPREAAERLAIARRLVADRCLYGVDINPMAVEMAKLSIWLITVDKSRPFTFLDHALKCGDSLIGISDFRQLEKFSLHDENAKQVIILSNYDELIRAAIAMRRELETLPSNDVTQIEAKKNLLANAEERLERLKLAADLLIAAELTEGKEQKKDMARAAAHIKVAQYANEPVAELRRFAEDQLFGLRTLHWPLEYPEIFVCGGFNALVGNPPFLGGKRLTTVLGESYMLGLKAVVSSQKGAADLCGYFFLRAESLLSQNGTFGLLATNSISEGDTREVGLAAMLSRGAAIYRANRNAPWPGAAGVNVSHIHVSRKKQAMPVFLDGIAVESISSYLEPEAVELTPHQLAENSGWASIGTCVNGTGFIISPSEYEEMVSVDSRNAEVLQPFLTSEDINQAPDSQPTRYIINFGDRPIEEASLYQMPFDRVTRLVKPARDLLTRQVHEHCFWKHWDRREEVYTRLRRLSRAVVIGRVSKQHAFSFMESDWIAFDGVVMFLWDDFAHYALLQSSIHEVWVKRHMTTLQDRPRYSVSDCFLTFPLLRNLTEQPLARFGMDYFNHRSSIQKALRIGLTEIYNRVHNAQENSADIEKLRGLHVEMDQSVAKQYGWPDIDLGHGFHETKQGLRFTVSPSARRTLLARLLELNNARYEEERASVGERKARKISRQRGPANSKLEKTPVQGELL